MTFFDRHKALIITGLLYAILLLIMLNIKISNDRQNRVETLIELSEPPPKPEIDQQEMETAPQETERPEPVKTHQAYNQELQETEDVQSRLEEIFEKNSAASGASEESKTSGNYSIPKSKDPKKPSQTPGKEKKTVNKKASYDASTISFSLLGRRAIDIPNPVYTCDRSGKIVVNIVVNAEGAVTGTSINRASSSSTNECLTERALEYAAGAIFSPLPGRESQPGTITYNFQD